METGWMATSWVYPAEILPLSIRAKGMGLAAAADFLGNFIVSNPYSTPETEDRLSELTVYERWWKLLLPR
jgi:hypothetical protein